jgi:hypothetical protein
MSKAGLRRKYNREVDAKYDSKQVHFGESGELKAPEPPEPELVETGFAVPLDKNVLCPFCLNTGALQTFLVSTKEGVSHAKGHCPKCNTGMMLKNLIREWTPTTYAEWVFGYRRDFFKKIDFQAWGQRLKALEWDKPFWDRYRELKSESKEEGGDVNYEHQADEYEADFTKGD